MLMSKILPKKKLFIEVSKLFHEHKKLFNSIDDIVDLMDDLERELEFMLSSCVKYKTGRIELKGNVDIYNRDERNAFDTYPSTRRSNSYFLTKSPGLKQLYSSERVLLLLDRKNILIDNNLYQFENTNTDYQFEGKNVNGMYLSRALDLSRLLDLAKVKRYCKVDPDRITCFFAWLEKLSAFKERLLGYQGFNLCYYHKDNPDMSSNYLLVTVMHELNLSLTIDALPKIDKRLAEISKDREEAITKGKCFLSQIKKDNHSSRVILKLKGE